MRTSWSKNIYEILNPSYELTFQIVLLLFIRSQGIIQGLPEVQGQPKVQGLSEEQGVVSAILIEVDILLAEEEAGSFILTLLVKETGTNI